MTLTRYGYDAFALKLDGGGINHLGFDLRYSRPWRFSMP